MSNEEHVERKLAVILSADVKGYSRLMGEDEEATLHTLTAYREVIDALIYQHRGRIVGTAGDSVLAEFASVVDAVRWAVAIQQQLKIKNADLLTGQYEEAIAAYQRALSRNPNFLPAHFGLAVIYSEMGREEEARAEVAEILRINPNYSLEVARQRVPYKDPAVLERTLANLRRAGLK